MLPASRIAIGGAIACLLLALPACKPGEPASDPSTAAGADAPAASAAPDTQAAAPATTGADVGIRDALQKFLAVNSYRATLIDPATGKTTADLEFVAPDRVRIRMPGGMSQTIVGRTAYMSMDGKTMKTELPAGTPSIADTSKQALAGLDAAKVEYVGEESVDGVEARVYRTVTESGENKTWIATDSGLPIKAEAMATAPTGAPSRILMVYRDYNDPGIVIDIPQ